jgi:phosphoglycerol geranylgeranyltransferase
MLMSISNYINKSIKNKKIHFSLIDPDKQDPGAAGSLAKIAENSGSSAIMIGGSTIKSQNQVDETVKSIKNNCNLPTILFPSGARYLSNYADAVFFMSLLNSKNLNYIIGEHVKGALFIKNSNIEPISMGYVIVEPGMTVGRIGEVDLIKRNDIKTAVGYALSAQYLGMDFFYLEAGSGAQEPVPDNMIREVKNNIDIPLIVGGGIRDYNTAKAKAMAGADIIVTGTTLEKDINLKKTLNEIIKALEF